MQRQLILIYGRTGAGKTVLARALLQRLSVELEKPGIVIDTMAEHDDVLAVEVDSVKAWLLRHRSSPDVMRVLTVAAQSQEKDEEEFNWICEQLISSGVPAILYVDEVSYYTSPTRTAEGLRRLTRYGRHYGIDMILCALRAGSISRELSAQTTEYRIFKVVEPIDLDYFAKILPAEACQILPELEPHKYLTYRQDGTYVVSEPVNLTSN